MHNMKMKKHGAWLATAALVTEMGISGIATAADNPFQATDLGAGYQLASQDKHEEEPAAQTAKVEEDGHGDHDHGKDEKKAETEGKCGAEHMKTNEGKCGGNNH